jgi:hypothetical protein
LLQKRDWDGLPDLVTLASYAVSRSFRTAAIWRSSSSVKRRTSPAFRGAYERTEHQFENWLLTEAVWNNLQPSTLLDKETFKADLSYALRGDA